MKEQFMIPVSAEVRAGARVAGGDAITVEVSLDTEERVVEVPAELKTILDSSAVASEKFSKMSYSNKLRLSLAISTAKTPETMAKRIEKVTAELTG